MTTNKTNTFGKTGGILFSICLAVLGILMLIFPVGSLIVSTWLFVIGVGLYGIYNIFSYCSLPSGTRNSWQLVNGIILVILFIIMMPVYGEIKFFSNLNTIIFLLAFYSISNGINSIMMSSEIAEAGSSKGLCILSGVFSILLGVFMIARPFIAGVAEIYFLAAWLIVIAISIFFKALALNKK